MSSSTSIPQAEELVHHSHPTQDESIDFKSQANSIESALKQMFPTNTCHRNQQIIEPLTHSHHVIEQEPHTHHDNTETNSNIKTSVFELSNHHYILLIFRRFVKFEGCCFCNRRMFHLLEMYRSLKQLNVLPIVVYPEEERIGEEFFNSFDIPEIKEMFRIADPHQVYAEQFDISFQRKVPVKKVVTHLLPNIVIANKQGFKQPLRTPSSYDGNSFFIKPAMFLLRNGKIVKELRHDYADPCPDIIKEIILNNNLQDDHSLQQSMVTNDTRHILLHENSSQELSLQESSRELSTDKNQEISKEKNHEIISLPEEQAVLTSKTTLQSEEQFHSFFSKPSPRYRITKTNQLASLQEISKDMKEQEEVERNEKVKHQLEKMKNSSSSCFGNSQQELINSKISSLDMITVLQTEHYRKYFKIFSHKEYNSENIQFWEEVHLKYKPVADFEKKDKAYQVAMKIGQQFLFDESTITYINTTDRLRNEVKNQISTIFKHTEISSAETKQQFNEKAPLIFDCVLSEMYASLMKDMFLRFSVSDLFKEMIATSETRKRK
ncbi:hypothetical protein C9374_011989 [Naegleria lovaniensis]|uniref:RGS domain-containing protein n=1 Tax=Naegleria lovaniensis TaxID=51637 RepID=A0AA88GBR3_NAELO|nr:uncharacterized protein C9374_011989 [Naegleria lovaniensis]KAG2373526.1 hypothetical protein C9374_011989 [Naegleria lovaniensis]